MSVIEEIASCCKKLRLSGNIVENIKKIKETDNELFLHQLFKLELDHRKHNRRLRNIKNAGFYASKGFANYVFDDIKLPDTLSADDIIAGEFINNKQNLIMYGNPGTGKTHLATAIGYAACRNDLKVGFFRTAGLVNKLLEAKRKNEFDIFMSKLARLDLIIADEWGYVPLDKEGSQLLFHVISEYTMRFKHCRRTATVMAYTKWYSCLINYLLYLIHFIKSAGKRLFTIDWFTCFSSCLDNRQAKLLCGRNT